MSELNEIETVCKTPHIIRFSFGIEEANTYAIVKNNHAVLIDACSENILQELLKRDITPDYVILTHEHCDHLWGLNTLKRYYKEMKVIAQQECSRAITDNKLNKSIQYRIYAILRYGKFYQNKEASNNNYKCAPADISFDKEYRLDWYGVSFKLTYTPGHSLGSCLISIDGTGIFSGDTMILGDENSLLFTGSNLHDYEIITAPILALIADEDNIFPGHGKGFKKKDWCINGQLVRKKSEYCNRFY